MFRIVLCCALLLGSISSARAQFEETANSHGPRPDRTLTQRFKVGVIIRAAGACQGIKATLPVPIEWPEQKVQLVDEDVSPDVRGVEYRTVSGSVKQMVVDIPSLAAGQEARAILTVEISRATLLPPEDPSRFSIPKKPDRSLLNYLGASPYIETNHAKIKAVAKQLQADAEGKSDWEKVEAIYDWVRENVEYKNGEIKGAARALKDKTGDCEELSALFIAICRINKIPARTVWVPEHCYSEFYLVDDEGQGYWFPCQNAGTRAFGGIPEQRPILQKGDNFRDPDRPRERMRYLSEHMTGEKVGGKPRVTWIRERVGT